MSHWTKYSCGQYDSPQVILFHENTRTPLDCSIIQLLINMISHHMLIITFLNLERKLFLYSYL